jgi:Ca2+-binding EF-hand superfamily protein
MEITRVSPTVIQSELKKYFNQVDKENIGVITQPEFFTLVKNIGIKLTPQEEKDILKKVDPQESGMV